MTHLQQYSYEFLRSHTEPSYRKLYGELSPQHKAVLTEMQRRLRPGRP